MAYKITGKIIELGSAQTLPSKSGSTYTKRDLIIAVRLFDQYTGQPTEDSNNTPKFTFFGDRCRDLDQFKVGDIVVVDFDISGRSYMKDNKVEYIADIRPFRVYASKQGSAQANQQPTPQPTIMQPPTVKYPTAQPQYMPYVHPNANDNSPF